MTTSERAAGGPGASEAQDEGAAERAAERAGGQGAVEPSLDRYARMVRRALGVPTALVSIVEDDRQVFPGAVGLPEAYQQSRQTPLSHSLCQYVVQEAQPLVITDARTDLRVKDSLAIPDLGVVAYAGWPLLDASGVTIGSVCAIDSEPRQWTSADLEALQDLAAACSMELEQRELYRNAAELAERYAAVWTSSRLLLALSEALATTRTIADVSVAVEHVARRELGCLQAGIWLRDVKDPTHLEPVRTATNGSTPEPLIFVENDLTDWTQASRHATLGVSFDNPLGEALLVDDLLRFADRAAQNARYPHLETPDQVGESRAFVPLRIAEQTYGSLALVWPGTRSLGVSDLESIDALRSYTTQAIQRALLLQERVDVALTLQNAMMTDLPQPDHLQLAARYLPAVERDRVGGDWYDSVVLPDGTTHLMVGDVVGHDMQAAAVMGQLRGMLRSFAWTHTALTETPARIVERLDRAADELGLDALATLVHARIEPSAYGGGGDVHALRWTNAGHPPPLLLHQDGMVETLGAAFDRPGAESQIDPMLGATPQEARHDHVHPMPAGATLLMYTDGLVERRDEDLDQGIDRAVGAMRRHRGQPLEALLDGVLADLVGTSPTDDVVVLAVRFHTETGPRPLHSIVDPASARPGAGAP